MAKVAETATGARVKFDPYRPGIGPPEHGNGLFSLNYDSERLQNLVVWIEIRPPGSEREGKFHPFYPPDSTTGCLQNLVPASPPGLASAVSSVSSHFMAGVSPGRSPESVPAGLPESAAAE